MAVPDVGDITAASIVDFFASEAAGEAHTLAGIIQPTPVEQRTGGVLDGKTFVLTGTLPSLSREDAKSRIEAAGGSARVLYSRKPLRLSPYRSR